MGIGSKVIGEEMGSCQHFPSRTNIFSQRESETQLMSWDQPSPSPSRPTSVANLCSAGHKEERRGKAGYSKEPIKETTCSCTRDENKRQEPLLCSWMSPVIELDERVVKLSESGWDSTFRCVNAVLEGSSLFFR